MGISLDPGLISAMLNVCLVALVCGAVGSALMAVGFSRRGHSARKGAVTGLLLGMSIGLMLIGSLGIAASNSTDRVSHRLLGMASVGAGLVFLFLLRLFGPREHSGNAKATGEYSQLNIPIPKTMRKPKADSAPAASPAIRKIFLSYRREDSADATGRIYDHLAGRYGKASIFKDVDSIPFGVDFRTHLQGVLGACDVVLVIISDRWLNAADSIGERRLNDSADFVRIEVEAALQRHIPVIPVLVNGASMPRAHDLPEPMRELAYRNGLAVRHDPDFHNDMERLVKSLEQG